MSHPIVRFAPSPTGHIHIGNVRTALFNWLYAKKNGGAFILRFDDTDKSRSRQEFAESILQDLTWLGVHPDRIEYQSARFERYLELTQSLQDKGLLYPCYETEDELARRRQRRRARGLPPIYDRAALRLTDKEKKDLAAQGRRPHWRFLLPNYEGDVFAIKRTEVHWDDLICGPQTVDLGSMSDPVLLRGDGTWLYTLTSVIDDADFAVSHVIRGNDHITNTGVQIAIFRGLGHAPPAFGHHNLLIGAGGEGLSKRHGSLSVASLREEGFEPMAPAIMASLLGTSEPIEPVRDMALLQARLDMRKISKSPARFDLAELRNLNAKILHATPYEEVKERLSTLALAEPEAFWLAVRGNLEFFSDVRLWREVTEGDIDPVIEPEDEEFIKQTAAYLPDEPWSEATWMEFAQAVKAATGRKGRALFMPLRRALTGQKSGPEMKALLPLIGRKRTLARLS